MKVPWQKERSTGGETAVQLRSGGRSTFGRLESYVPLLDGETALYREVREAVPVVDAAICKLIRLTGGVRVACGNERAEQGLQRFLCEVPVGRGQRGINAFLDCYLDSLLTCGRAVGEIVPDAEGREIAAGLCARGTIRSNSACAVWMAAGAACRSSIRTCCSLRRSTPKRGTLTAFRCCARCRT